MSGEWKNEGEGSRSGAKAYDDATKRFVDSGRVKEQAEKAKMARDGSERAALDRAEAAGRSHSKGEDPALRRHDPDDAIDVSAALLNPAGQFKDPTEVLNNRSLSRAEKLKILQQWELDARQLSVAEEENMAGGEENMVGRVSRAMLALGGESEGGGDTKLG
jgi:hypothetical protein